MKLLVLVVLPFASAFKLPISPKLSATAVTLAAPLPALAVYEPIHKVLPGTEYGDVIMSQNNVASAALGLVMLLGVFFAFFDYMLKFGAEKACIISSTTGKKVCGYILDASQAGCVLTDHDGWQCA